MSAQPQKTSRILTVSTIVILVLILVAGIFIFLGQNVTNIFTPTKPLITSPIDDTFVTNFPVNISGSTTPNTRLRLSIDGQEVDVRDHKDDIFWNYSIETLAPGEHRFTAQTVNYAGIASDAASVALIVPNKPTIDAPRSGETVTRAELGISGMAEPKAQVNLFSDGEFLRTVQADDMGKFIITELGGFPLGKHKISVESVKTIGNFGNFSEEREIVVVQ